MVNEKDKILGESPPSSSAGSRQAVVCQVNPDYWLSRPSWASHVGELTEKCAANSVVRWVSTIFHVETFPLTSHFNGDSLIPAKLGPRKRKVSRGNKFEISRLRSGLPDLHNLSQVLLLDTNLCQQVSVLCRPELSQWFKLTNGFQVSDLPFPQVKYSYFPVSLSSPVRLSSPRGKRWKVWGDRQQLHYQVIITIW